MPPARAPKNVTVRTACAVPPCLPTAAMTSWLLIAGRVIWVLKAPPVTSTFCFTPLTERYTDDAVVVPLTVTVRVEAVDRSAGLVTVSCGAAGGACLA